MELDFEWAWICGMKRGIVIPNSEMRKAAVLVWRGFFDAYKMWEANSSLWVDK